ncbi:MAG: PLP-dependent aminotransferase family protein [Candidatus Riflebacteria bacterium]|nr:PLP-dependent aminotransferase family protein [Candidatus Riflebacteria bacterium]
MEFDARMAARTRGRRTSIIRELLKVATTPGVISLGGGYPSPATFPMENLTFTASGESFALTRKELESACQYGPSLGQAELIPRLQEWHKAKSKVELGADQICVINGSQEGLFVLGYLFLDPGDPVALTEPTYPGALGAFSAFTDNFLPIPQDARGMDPRALEEYLVRRSRKGMTPPKFVYVTPNCHNPAGVTMDEPRRREIYAIVEQHDLLLLEDDPYELIKFTTDAYYPSFQSMDTAGRVVRLDSFSKVFVPGFRMGYASGPRELIKEFNLFKQAANLHTSSFNQVILATYLKKVGPDGMFERIRKNCAMYRRNYEALVSALDRELKDQVSFNRPDGGFFLWMELSQANGRIDTMEMIAGLAVSTGVLLVPGPGFSLTGSLSNYLRASFSQQSPDEIAEAIRRLARMLVEYRMMQKDKASIEPKRGDG